MPVRSRSRRAHVRAGIIALIGLAVALGNAGFSRLVARSREGAVPGPGGNLLTDAVPRRTAPALAPLRRSHLRTRGALISGSTLHGADRTRLNRIYGVEQDRPTLQKYGLALVLTISAGTLAIGAFALLAFGQSIGDSIDNSAPQPKRGSSSRWPLAVALVTLAITMLFRWSPRRHQPALVAGVRALVAAIGWLVVTAGLSVFFAVEQVVRANLRSAGGHGRVAALVASAPRSPCSTAAQSAPARSGPSGARKPQDAEKVEHSEPDRQRARLAWHHRDDGARRDRRSRAARRDDSPNACGARSKASSASRRPKATASTCCATATRSSPRCWSRSRAPATPSTS
jgi:hypothetical protein